MNIYWQKEYRNDMGDALSTPFQGETIYVCLMRNSSSKYQVAIEKTHIYSDRYIIPEFTNIRSKEEALIIAHRYIEFCISQLFNFEITKKDIHGYKSVILYDKEEKVFKCGSITCTIPKGSVIHKGTKGKWRANNAIITFEPNNKFEVLSPYIVFSEYHYFMRRSVSYRVAFLNYASFIEHIVGKRGKYEAGQEITIKDYSYYDEDCAPGFHYFNSEFEAQIYCSYLEDDISKLNDFCKHPEITRY